MLDFKTIKIVFLTTKPLRYFYGKDVYVDNKQFERNFKIYLCATNQ